MPTFKVLWSMRGRAYIEANNKEHAAEVFYNLLEEDLVYMGDNDGYELDRVVEEEHIPPQSLKDALA